MMWTIVLPLRRAFLYIKLATDLRSRAPIYQSIDSQTHRIGQNADETEDDETKAKQLQLGLKE